MAGTQRGRSLERAPSRGLSPFPEMLELQRSLDRIFGPNTFGLAEQTATSWQPPVDIFENENEIVIKVELPEVQKEDVEVNLDDRTLTIRGERRLEHEDRREGYHRVERTYGQFARSFTVPPNISREGLRAQYRDGVLRITLPKLEEAKPRQITVD